ncbi:hypothetical protein [Halorhabdus sp. CUG00001]|uniref:DUF7260 family protein n=1 Tax=Halorhabdus sp. CUG00001 TaxID=2600297 RepID=UPI00131CB2C2|nr:hypothetical protein [Halorhabdus sp. CUG00001]
MTKISQPTIDCARRAIERERTSLEHEREAFRTLIRRVSNLQPEAVPSPVSGSGAAATAMTATASRPSRDLQAIRDAYRETVMAVPHYETAYGDTLRESLTLECGPSLAGHLLDGERLTPPTYGAFLTACKQARDERQQTLQRIEREQESLERFAPALEDIERDVARAGEQIDAASNTGELSEIDDQLETRETECESLASERQRQIHERAWTDIDGVDLGFFEYVYSELETTTPVLAAIAARLETIRSHRVRCLH